MSITIVTTNPNRPAKRGSSEKVANRFIRSFRYVGALFPMSA